MVRLWAIGYTHAVKKVLNWVATLTTGNDGAIASLAILIALQALIRSRLRVLSEGTDSCADSLGHFKILINNHVSVLLSGNCGALRVALTHEQLVCRVGADHAIDFECTVADLA